MASQERRYKTRQRDAIVDHLALNADAYLSVDDVWMGVCLGGNHVGRTTVYRCLESMVKDGSALKATSPRGEARYRLSKGTHSGQLVCLTCGRVYPLDCHMVADLTKHVSEEHGFKIDVQRTVLYGQCRACTGTAS